MTAEESNFAGARAFVEFGLKEKNLGRRESASGPGSALATAGPCLGLLDAIVPEFAIGSILDLGCGDWNWMRHAAWRGEETVQYEGWDAHEALVDSLTQSFGDARTRFRVADLTTEPMPPVDLVICRDVFFHLPLAITQRVIQRIRANRGLLLSTSFLGEAVNNDIRPYLEIEKWGFYRINLDIAPFDLGPFRIRTIAEPGGAHGGQQRSVCLFDFRA